MALSQNDPFQLGGVAKGERATRKTRTRRRIRRFWDTKGYKVKTTIKITKEGHQAKEVEISDEELIKRLGVKDGEEIRFITHKNDKLTYDIGSKETCYCPYFKEYLIDGRTICSYNYTFPVIGSKISALTYVTGYAFIDTDEHEGFSVVGVQPGDFCGLGKTALEALVSFKKNLLSVLIDTIEETDNIDDFKKKLGELYREFPLNTDLPLLKEMLTKPAGRIIVIHKGVLDGDTSQTDIVQYDLSEIYLTFL